VRDWLILLIAVVVGFFLLGYDQLIVALSLALAFAAPRRWFAIGLGVALPIAAGSAINGHIDVAGVVLVIAMVGAGVGWMMRRGTLLAAR